MRDRKKAPFLVVSGAFLLKMRRKVYIISSFSDGVFLPVTFGAYACASFSFVS
jgi:hypothetical protein